MICPNCKRELAEGEVCNCTQNEQTHPQDSYENQNTEQQNYYQPEQNSHNTYYTSPNDFQGTYYDPNASQNNYYDPNSTGGYYPPVQDPIIARTDYPQGYKIKKKYVAVILAFTLGFLGIHNFYLGYSSKAIAQVLLATVGSLFFGIGIVAAAVWSLVEAVQLLTEAIDRDANGFKIRTIEEFIEQTVDKKD